MKVVICEVTYGELYGMYLLRIDEKAHKSLEDKDLLEFAVRAKIKETGMKLSQFTIKDMKDLPAIEDKIEIKEA